MSGGEDMVERVAMAIWAARIQRCRDLGAPEDMIPWPWEQENETLHENVRGEARAAIEAIVAAADEVPYDPHGAEVTLLHHWFAEHYSAAEWMDDGCRSENARDLLNAMSKAGFIVVPLRSSLTGDSK